MSSTPNSDAAGRAFALALQWWYWRDAYYVSVLRHKPSELNKFIRDIGNVYLVNRTIPKEQEEALVQRICASGQTENMPLINRAEALAAALRHPNFSNRQPASAASKLSWFVWPRNWTMYDRNAAVAVLGSRRIKEPENMLEFYAALAGRGWNELISNLRDHLERTEFHPLLAERTADKFLYLTGSGSDSVSALAAQGFVGALPPKVAESAGAVGERLARVLRASSLLLTNE